MTGTAIDHVLAFLIPIFLAGASGDQAAARRAAIELLEAHSTATGRELLLSGEIIAFSFATLDSLGKSMADPLMAITTRLRLRSNANALSRATERNRQALERPRRPLTPTAISAPQALPAPVVSPASLPTAMQKVRDAIVEAAPSLAETLTQAVSAPMSRQQRRFLTRKAEQARAAQERDARRTARLSERAAAIAADKAKDVHNAPPSQKTDQLQMVTSV